MVDTPLHNLRVIDCASIYAGPLAATYLGDFGAEVIKIEHPEGETLREYGPHEDLSTAWYWVGRNKKSVPIDLHSNEGQELVKELVADADVFIENFRPGTLESWNLGWEDLSAVNPDLVMARVTGFGQTGPYKDRPGFGTLAEAMSGFAYVTGEEDGPPTLPALGLADAIAAISTTAAVMFALYWRDQYEGTGQYIDTSILEPIFSIMGEYVVDYGVEGIVHRRSGNRDPYTAPRNTYQTKDDRWVALSGAAESIAKRQLRIVGGEELVNDPRFQTPEDRIENVEELDEIIQEWMSRHDRDEVIEIFEANEAAIAPVYNHEEIFADPHFQARDSIVEVDHDEIGEVPMPNVFPKLSETPGRIDHPGPDLGAHAREVLLEHTSLSEGDLIELAERGIITLD